MSDPARNVPDANVTILDVAEWSRFEIHVDGKLAGFAVYRIRPGAITFTHTEIDDAYEGQGLGSTLVRAALDVARARRLAVLPECPFVRSWITKHEDYADLVPEAERPRFGL
jgi:predicted GNAT family acetyltransferase